MAHDCVCARAKIYFTTLEIARRFFYRTETSCDYVISPENHCPLQALGVEEVPEGVRMTFLPSGYKFRSIKEP